MLVRSLRWRYPEWWSIVLSAAAWAVLVGRAWPGSESHHLLVGLWAWAEHTGTWLLMVLAMMVPLVVSRFA